MTQPADHEDLSKVTEEEPDQPEAQDDDEPWGEEGGDADADRA